MDDPVAPTDNKTADPVITDCETGCVVITGDRTTWFTDKFAVLLVILPALLVTVTV